MALSANDYATYVAPLMAKIERLREALEETVRVLDWSTTQGQDDPALPTVVNAYLKSARKILDG